jgi:hypothetical protein
MTDLTLEQFISQELTDLEGFKKFYLSAVARYPEHFGTSQTEELWYEELRAYTECREFNPTCLQCSPETCDLVIERVADIDT